VLDRLATLPLYTWRYKTEVSGATHLGPTAQDFRAAFGLGDSERSITTIDADGVMLASLQALQQRLAARQAMIDARAARIEALRARVAALEATAADVTLLKAALATLLPRDPYATVRAIYP
jgi:hypothetical protein